MPSLSCYTLFSCIGPQYKFPSWLWPCLWHVRKGSLVKKIVCLCYKNGWMRCENSLSVFDYVEIWVYFERSDVTYLWSQCNRHFVGQHVVLCVVKWWRLVALLESNWISWFTKMSLLSLSYWESDVYWRQNNKHFTDLSPQNGRKQLIWRNYVTVTLCILWLHCSHNCWNIGTNQEW